MVAKANFASRINKKGGSMGVSDSATASAAWAIPS